MRLQKYILIQYLYININSLFVKNYIKLDHITSTSDYILSLKGTEIFTDGLVVSANFQTRGRGQMNSSWESKDGKNLILSFLLELKLDTKYQFLISQYTSLAIYDFLNKYIKNIKIKWPNDILINGKKISGILINNITKKNTINFSVIGIGININQKKFTANNATSLSILTNNAFDLSLLEKELFTCFNYRFKNLKDLINIDKEYLSKLFLFKKLVKYKDLNGFFHGYIDGVDSLGRLIIVKEDGKKYYYQLKELNFPNF